MTEVEEVFYAFTDNQGRITIPLKIRRHLNITPGTNLRLTVRRAT